MFILGQESEDGYLPVEILLHTLRRMDHDYTLVGHSALSPQLQ